MRGRPQLFDGGHQVNVRVSVEDYRALRARVAQLAADQPGYSLGDLLRGYIRQGLGEGALPRRETDPRAARIRQLRVIARTALKVAEELKTA